jgi:hypothetical protein
MTSVIVDAKGVLMETARQLESEPQKQKAKRPPLQLLYLAQVDPEKWFKDLWTYIELNEEDTGA